MSTSHNTRREFLRNSGMIAAAGAGLGMGLPRAEGAPLSSVVRGSKHVLLISVDGIHAIDLDLFVKAHPGSTLAQLSDRGITYTEAACPRPSDSFPGLMALVTGGSPRSTGIWYDVAFDRKLLGPGGLGGPGTVTQYMEAIDPDSNRLDGGALPPRAPTSGDFAFTLGQGIDPTKLPVDPITLAPVMPWKFIRVNTIFEVAHAHGRRTAWSDKHVGAYQAVFGPSGTGVDDYFSPEINSLAAQLEGGLPLGDQFTNSHIAIKIYDSIKVKAVVNQCRGFNSTGTLPVGTPAIFGMNFQALSVAQKTFLEIDSPLRGGYADADGTPGTAIEAALDFVDGSLEAMVDGLQSHGILHDTTIIITAKHGQCPINLQKRRIIPGASFSDVIDPIVGAGNYAVTADDSGLIWLKAPFQHLTPTVVAALWASAEFNNLPAQADPNAAIPGWQEPTWPANPGIEDILWGDTLKLRFNDPLLDSRTPDIIVLPTPGVIWAGKKSAKLAEHGGFAHADTNVALLVSKPGIPKRTLKTPVDTTQVAPTILKILGLDPDDLEAVVKEKTDELPFYDA
jgi:hypothetical protein